MSTADRARPGWHRTTREALRTEQVETDGGSGDIGDAVERADFVKVDLFDRHTVYGCLGVRQAMEDAPGQLALTRRQAAAREDLLDFGEEAVRLLLRGLDAHVG